MEQSEVPTDEPKKHGKGFWKGVVGAVRKSSKEHGKDRPKSKASDQSDHPPIEERAEPANFSTTTLPEDRPRSKFSDQAVYPLVEERPDSDNFLRTNLPAHKTVSRELIQGERWEHNPEGKPAEVLAEEYRDLIGPHPLEEDSDSEYSDATMTATVTEPETHNNRATQMTTWTGIMRAASETTPETTRVAQSREKLVPKKRSPKQMSEVQRRIRNIEQAQRGLAPVEEAKVAPDIEAEAFVLAKKRLENLHRDGEQKLGESKPKAPTLNMRSPGASQPMSNSPTLSTQSSRSRGESKPIPKAQPSIVSSSRSSGSSAERKASLPKERTANVQSSGTRRSDQDIEAETSRSRNFPRNKTFSPTKKVQDGLGLSGMHLHFKG